MEGGEFTEGVEGTMGASDGCGGLNLDDAATDAYVGKTSSESEPESWIESDEHQSERSFLTKANLQDGGSLNSGLVLYQ